MKKILILNKVTIGSFRAPELRKINAGQLETLNCPRTEPGDTIWSSSPDCTVVECDELY